MAPRRIGIRGESPAAQAYAAGAQVLGWHVSVGTDHDGTDIVVPPPIAASLVEADAMIEMAGRRAFGWPLITTTATQEMLRRAPSIGAVTNLSSRSTRPPPPDIASLAGGALLCSGHDQVALTLLIARLVGMGAPHSVRGSVSLGVGGVEDGGDVAITFDGGLTAHVHADWHSESVVSQEFQLAGEAGVLRSETDPRPSLEFNGDSMTLATTRVADEQHRPLYESGVIDMLKAILSGFDAGVLPLAFTLAFGRDVLEVIFAAYCSADRHEPVALPFTGDRTVRSSDR